MKYTALAILALTLTAPAFAADSVPTLSGKYLWVRTIICSLGTSWQHTQEVATAAFDPKKGRVVFQNDAVNLASSGSARFQNAASPEPATLQIVGLHDVNIGGGDWWVQFGGVKNGIATTAALLSINSNNTCASQATVTRNSP